MATRPDPVSHSAPRPEHRVRAFDGLRGVAALMVLTHHALLMLPDFAGWEWFGPGQPTHGPIEWLLLRTPLALVWAGQARALLFFVLSGFVLGLPWLEGRSVPYGRFLLGRFCRIYPPYLIAMIAAAVGSILLGGHLLPGTTIYFNSLGWAFRPSWAAIPSILTLTDNQSMQYMNEAVWSLVWEVRVAIIFPAVLFPILRWGNRGVLAALVGLTLTHELTLGLLSPGMTMLLDKPADTFAFAEFFVFGAAVAVNRGAIVAWFGQRRPAYGLISLGVGCLMCWVPWPREHDHLLGVGATIILVAILGTPRVQGWLQARWLLWLGGRSYSLYLIHVPVIMMAVIASGGHVTVWLLFAAVALAIILSDFFHHLVELPSVGLAQRLTGYSLQSRHRGPPGGIAGWLIRRARAVDAALPLA